jgi:hypothetical protein
MPGYSATKRPLTSPGHGAYSPSALAIQRHSLTTQNEVLAKSVCGNVCAVIQAMYEMGVNPVFWADQAQAG